MRAIRHLKVVGPTNVKRTVALPLRKPNATYRFREHLTEREVERLVEAAKDAIALHHGSVGLQARSAGRRAGGRALGAGGPGKHHPARP